MLLLNKIGAEDIQGNKHFNTSYVVIKPIPALNSVVVYVISIHLMLLLNLDNYNLAYKRCLISIHLMLLLNTCISRYPLLIILISIHLMLLLNGTHTASGGSDAAFQYILCCY